MNKQDSSPIRNFTEVEKRLQGLLKNLNKANARVVQINNELATMMKTLLINLSEYMNQGEVQLWFYSGVPTTSNKPYTDWQTPSEHEGDFYYDKESGLVYQFSLQNNWQNIQDNDLVQAMSLTNAELQSGDNERKVFLSQPIPPYDSGDWYIKDNGDLYLCQISKEISEEYAADDFIISSMYQMTVASKSAEELTVLKGTVTRISEDYVSVTDLATGGSTEIAGENISTGSIKSNNYVQNTSGTKINLSNGTIDTKNFKVDAQGNITGNNSTFSNVNISEGKMKFNDGPNRIASIEFTDPNDTTDIKSVFFSHLISVGIDPNAFDYGLIDGATIEGFYDESGGISIGGFSSRSPARNKNWHPNLTNDMYGFVCQDFNESNGGTELSCTTRIGSNIIELMDTNHTAGTEVKLTITPSGVSPSSIESVKKNIEPFEDALEILKNVDIYKYHLVNQKDSEKKNIGFIIGDKYNYSKAITSEDNKGVNLYSMISVLWQAVKQQQKEIEKFNAKEGEN